MARKVTVVAVIEQYATGCYDLRTAGKVVAARIRKALSKEGLFGVDIITVCPGTTAEECVEHLRGNL